jgi:4a-hydroxytetrahydrobiopterin dehydratase
MTSPAFLPGASGKAWLPYAPTGGLSQFRCIPLSSRLIGSPRPSSRRTRRFCTVASAAGERRGAEAVVARLRAAAPATVALGGSDHAALTAFAAALAASSESGDAALAFLPVSPAAAAAAKQHGIPLADHLTAAAPIDVYFAAVAQMDSDLNAALSSTDGPALQSERFAASLAACSLLLVDEAYFTATSDGLLSFHIGLDAGMPSRAVDIIRGSSLLKDFGVAEVNLRTDTVADVLLAPAADLAAIDTALQSMPGVATVGILPAGANTTAIVAAADHSYEITSSLATLVSLAVGSHKDLEVLPVDERSRAIKQLGPGWVVTTDGRVGIERGFRFKSPDHAMAFVTRVYRMGSLADSFPEVSITFNRVHVHIATVEAHGVTSLDIALAREITRTCDLLIGCTV